MLNRIAKIAGMDAAIGYTVLARIIQAGGGIILIFLISAFLTPQEQGYYYTFGSIVALQIFFDLGLNAIITQYVAHEVAHLSWSNLTLTGDADKISRVSSLLRFCLKVFSSLAVVLLAVLSFAGILFFDHYGLSADVNWRIPWQLLAFSTSLLFLLSPLLAFLEGLGKVKEVAQIRLAQQIANLTAIAAVIAGGGGLLASGIGVFVSALAYAVMLLRPECRKLLVNIYKQKGAAHVSYAKEILPYQWRIALSWMSGYFIFQLFNPVVFASEGAATAGQMGMTWAALNGITSLSMSWINTKVPLLSGFIARKEYTQLDETFGRTTRQLISINLLLVLTFMAFLLVVNQMELGLAARFLPLLPSTLLVITVVVNQLIFSWATYLRCHKAEPYLMNSVVGGMMIASSTIWLGAKWGVLGIVAGYTFITIFVGLPWAYIVFRKKKLEWHAA